MNEDSKLSREIGLLKGNPTLLMSPKTSSSAPAKGQTSKQTTSGSANCSRTPQAAQRRQMVSVGTQTGVEVDLIQRCRLIRKQLGELIHAVLCGVRDEINENIEAQAIPCSIEYCGLMKSVVAHLKTCNAGRECKIPHCFSSCQTLHHWNSCREPNCRVCSDLRQRTPACVELFLKNPRARDALLERYQWVIRFARARLVQDPQHFQDREQADETNGMKSFEE